MRARAVGGRVGFHEAAAPRIFPLWTVAAMSIQLCLPQQDEFLSLFDSPGLHAPESANLLRLSQGLLVVRGNKSVEAMAAAVLDPRVASSLTRFLAGKWDVRGFTACGRRAMARLMAGARVVYHCVDDTANPHAPAEREPSYRRRGTVMQALDFHYDHNAHAQFIGHTVVTTHVVAGTWSAPWRHEIYRREQDCAHAGIVFRSKVQIAAELIADFEPPAGARELWHLVDSWYMNAATMAAVDARAGHYLAGALKYNSVLVPEGEQRPRRLRDIAKALRTDQLETVTVEKTAYETFTIRGTLFDRPGTTVVIVRKQGTSGWVLLAGTKPGIGAAALIAHYTRRWHIETGHWYLKCALGFGDYRVRSLHAIERTWAVCLFTLWYLEWLRHRCGLGTIAIAQRCYLADFGQKQAIALWRRTRHCQTEQEVAAIIHLAA